MICPCCGKPKKPEGLDGLGTALKPAMELICLARKPLARGKTIAGNVMAYGTGALNIDACRVATNELLDGGGTVDKSNYSTVTLPSVPVRGRTGGRWPANVVTDGSPEVVEGFPETGAATASTGRNGRDVGDVFSLTRSDDKIRGHDDNGGSAARFFATFPQELQSRMFYTSKADKTDRLGSVHPTVKPLNLIRWLTRLITPPGGTILDCFAGTGITGEAALIEGLKSVLIEKETEYIADIDRRMALALEGSTSRSVAMAKLKPEGEPLPLFAEAAE